MVHAEGCDTYAAFVRMKELSESSSVRVTSKQEASLKEVDTVKRRNRVEYVRGSFSDDGAVSFATRLLFKAQTQMRGALLDERRNGGQLDDKRINRIIKANLEGIVVR
ncbi:hypothetical protein GNI_132880 [Gregarina niphandrodes]|uniref:Uncharacterized protein n=1 Tax=Gregarina niphandrodes TaxID=110365 RepID=A0A023B1K0_GRENI|nr:hypothetical protein GNI_132880 [Gregarina niphandrodes]EZG46814.1 hypothetical protein GNI_132880 [Gregarina niphandrodes]|eukprot:XP_011132238.1 hypothetical protein GNI_132880 [Gregarina niphandrodes]